MGRQDFLPALLPEPVCELAGTHDRVVDYYWFHRRGIFTLLGFPAGFLCSDIPLLHTRSGRDHGKDFSGLIVTGACETPRDIHYSNACLYVAAVGDIVSDLMSESSCHQCSDAMLTPE